MKKLLAAMFVALLMAGCGEDGDIAIPKMIKCDGCQKAVYSSADDCPNCGHPVEDSVGVYVEEREEIIKQAYDFIGLTEEEARNEANQGGGKEGGLWTTWYQNGQKKFEGNFTDGKQEGLWTSWYENGQKKWEGNFKADKLISGVIWKPNGEKCPVTKVVNGNGVWVGYYENGDKKWEGNWKDGNLVTAVVWKPNCEKCPVTNVKDGNGVVVWYKKDGTVSHRQTYKAGEIVRD